MNLKRGIPDIMYYFCIAGKLSAAEGSPVYVNDEGECVTDLAYYHPFVEAGANEGAAYNPFDSSNISGAGFQTNEVGNFSMGKNIAVRSKLFPF